MPKVQSGDVEVYRDDQILFIIISYCSADIKVCLAGVCVKGTVGTVLYSTTGSGCHPCARKAWLTTKKECPFPGRHMNVFLLMVDKNITQPSRSRPAGAWRTHTRRTYNRRFQVTIHAPVEAGGFVFWDSRCRRAMIMLWSLCAKTLRERLNSDVFGNFGESFVPGVPMAQLDMWAQQNRDECSSRCALFR